MSSTWVSSDWPTAPPPLKAVGAVLQDRPCFPERHMGSRQAQTPPPVLPPVAKLKEALPGMGPFPGSPPGRASTSPPPLCLAGGPRAPLPSRPLLDICLGRSQVGAWAACYSPAPALRGGGGGRQGGDVMNPWDLLLPLSYQQCCLPPVWVSFCECRAVSASRPLSTVLSPSASYQPRIPETYSNLADSTILWFVTVA